VHQPRYARQIELEENAVIAGRYRLTRRLGEGGMGVVWAATHQVTRKHVALKMLSARLGGRDDMRKRFLAEARAAASIEHPHVIGVSDVFELDNGTPVMVQDLLEGETLAARLEGTGPLGLEETARIMLPVIDAVAAAHERGVVHRDLKPDNVFLVDRDGQTVPMVLDFGIAKLLVQDKDDTDSVDTGTGTMLGSAGYMSPEQGFGEKDIDERADLWAIGVILYECLAGIRPVEADNLGQYLKRLMSDAITPLEALEPDLPATITSTVKALLETDRDDRLSDLDAVRAALEGDAVEVPKSQDSRTVSGIALAPSVTLEDSEERVAPRSSSLALVALGVAALGIVAWRVALPEPVAPAASTPTTALSAPTAASSPSIPTASSAPAAPSPSPTSQPSTEPSASARAVRQPAPPRRAVPPPPPTEPDSAGPPPKPESPPDGLAHDPPF
jgi:serine/threonine-protein kinase